MFDKYKPVLISSLTGKITESELVLDITEKVKRTN